MPVKEKFLGSYEYNSTLLHELAHASGHESRLNRSSLTEKGRENYAKEELRAEIASSFISAELPLKFSEDKLVNHQAYVQSWIKCIKEDEKELFKAISDASKIADYLIEKGELKKYIETTLNVEFKDDISHVDKTIKRRR